MPKLFFPGGVGGVHKTCGNSGGVGGGGTFVSKKWKLRGGGGDLREIPSVVGVWIFSGTTHYIFHDTEQKNEIVYLQVGNFL